MGKNKSNSKTEKNNQGAGLPREAWIKPRTGLIVIAIVSVLLAGYMFWQLLPTEGLGGALLWGLGAGASIWAIFGLNYLVNRTVRRS
nr:hypothetical protein [Anaerolineae bacterium]